MSVLDRIKDKIEEFDNIDDDFFENASPTKIGTLLDDIKISNPVLKALVNQYQKLAQDNSKKYTSRRGKGHSDEAKNTYGQLKAEGLVDLRYGPEDFDTISEKLSNSNLIMLSDETPLQFKALLDNNNSKHKMAEHVAGKRPVYGYQFIYLVRENGDVEVHFRQSPHDQQFFSPDPILIDQRRYKSIKNTIQTLRRRLSPQKQGEYKKQLREIVFSSAPNKNQRLKGFVTSLKQDAGLENQTIKPEELRSVAWYTNDNVGGPFFTNLHISNMAKSKVSIVNYLPDKLPSADNHIRIKRNSLDNDDVRINFNTRPIKSEFIGLTEDTHEAMDAMGILINSVKQGTSINDNITALQEVLVDIEVAFKESPFVMSNLEINMDEASEAIRELTEYPDLSQLRSSLSTFTKSIKDTLGSKPHYVEATPLNLDQEAFFPSNQEVVDHFRNDWVAFKDDVKSDTPFSDILGYKPEIDFPHEAAAYSLKEAASQA